MLLNFELGVVPAAENYFELFKNSYFTDVPTLIGDLKSFFSFQIEHLTLKFACTLTKIKNVVILRQHDFVAGKTHKKNAVCGR